MHRTDWEQRIQKNPEMRNFLWFAGLPRLVELMSNKENADLIQLAEDIMTKRALPYSLIVEKVEGDEIFVRNNWGTHIKYVRKGETYEIVPTK